MRIVLTNFGTTGDIQPFLALAVALRRHGHEPVMAFSPNFSQRVTALNIPFVPVGPDLQKAQQHINHAWTTAPESAAHMQTILEPVVKMLPEAFETLRASCRNADVLVSGPAQPASRMIHELTGIPFVSVQLSNFGGAGPPALQQASTALINPFRTKLGLAPLANPLTLDANSPQLALYAISRHILPRPTDWPLHYHLTGYFFMDDGETPVDPGLLEFMEAEKRPIVITFGSMAGGNPQQLTALFLEAVRIAGCRAVIQQNWQGVDTTSLPSYVYPAGYVSHAWLFPKAACIIHHGGGGTAGAVFRSGVPSIFVPHGQIFDQFYFGILAEELGCAGPAIPYTELTPQWLAEAIVKTLNTPSFHQKSAVLGQKIRAEQGTETACHLIETLVQKVGLATSPATDSADSEEDRGDKMNRRKQFQLDRRTKRKEVE